ncbi:MAG: hypothetical protein L0Y71_02705 [Gemmataceae bacterium]|nr:hypothetical protein [Gemmataceae bacterium]
MLPRQDHLQGHDAVQPELSRLVHDAHAAAAEFLQDLETRQGRQSGRRRRAGRNRLVGELVADEIAVLQEFGDIPRIDLCLLCGDFYDYPDLRKLGGTGDVTPVLNAMSRIAARTVAVLGNHDEVANDQLAGSITILDDDVISTDSFVIGGVSGIVGDAARHQRRSEADFVKAVQRCAAARIQILMLHQGPQGPSDAYRGLSPINALLQARSGLLVLFGHCYWPDPFHIEGRNLFCNVDGRVLLFIPEGPRGERQEAVRKGVC